MKHGFLSPRGRGENRGVKEKESAFVDDSMKVNHHVDEVTSGNMAPITTNANDVDVNSETPLESNKGDDVNSNANVEPTASASLSDSVSFATLLKGDTSQKSVNFSTLITLTGNRADVVVPLESIYGFFLGNAMIELRIGVELKDTIVMARPKLVGEGFYICTIRVEYDWKPPRCSSCKVFGYILNEYPKKIVSNVAKNLNNPRQAIRGVLVGPKVRFKSTEQIYRPISNKNGASTSGKKKQAKVSRQNVSNLNPFDVLNSIENDNGLGTNRGGGNSKSVGKGSLNVAHGISSTTLIIDKIDKLERQINDDKLMFVDDDSLFLRVMWIVKVKWK
nr:hypothetical protein [Tanacetum cinerariifolium]